MKAMITGTAGFIGFHLARRLLEAGHEVLGVDGFTPYYDVRLKQARHAILKGYDGFAEEVLMLEDAERLSGAVQAHAPAVIVHLAAQAGVRYSLEQPRAYVDANLVGTFNVMEAARALGPRHLLVASTSSVYGANTVMPFTETQRTDHPLTLYAATKKATEEMTHSYAHLWRIPTTALRFFTVYGPWGRPDMALFKFVDATLRGAPIEVYNNGQMVRDFTYVDDLVDSLVRLIDCAPVAGEPVAGAVDSLSPVAPWRVVNVGGGQPVQLLAYIEAIESALGRKAARNYLPMQKGDVPATFASPALLEALTGYKPTTSVEDGVGAFVDWYRSYYGV